MHGVPRMAEHQGRRPERAPLAARRSYAAEEEALEERPCGTRFLPEDIQPDVAEMGQRATGYRTRRPRDDLHHRLTEGERQEHRCEGDRAAEQPVVEHGHLDHHRAQALRVVGGYLQCRVRAERGPHHYRLLYLEVIHQPDYLLAEDGHRVLPHVPRPVRAAVAEEVDGDDAVAVRGELFGERPVHLLGEQQPVDQDQRACAGRCAGRRPAPRAGVGDGRRPATELRVGDAMSLKSEERHRPTLLPAARGRRWRASFRDAPNLRHTSGAESWPNSPGSSQERPPP